MNRKEKWRRWQAALPHIGQRMLKTSIAVLLCLVFYGLRGYRGQDMPTEAVITAIICMQPYVRDTRDYALNRLDGTLIGAFWGIVFLLLLLFVPALGSNLFVTYVLMAIGVLLSLYTAVAVRKPDASSLSAIVFICIVITFPDVENPFLQAGDRFLGIFVGTVAAIGVNTFRLPRGRNRDLVFFLHTSDLVPDRFSQMTPSVSFRLNSLFQEGAKICMISAHAPAFFAPQLGTAPALPMIVMDGAAVYDVQSNRYIWAETIPEKASDKLRDYLERMGRSYFLYTVHKNKTCIFHRGEFSAAEQSVLYQLQRTPYRSYLDEENYAPEEIVYFKLIGADEEMERLRGELKQILRAGKLRAAVQPQAGVKGVSGLYIYSEHATVRRAENYLMQDLRRKEPNLKPVELQSPAGYRSEHDAMVLLFRLRNLYAPVRLFPSRRST